MLKLSPKIIFLISSFVLLTNQSVGGAKLKCEYSTGGWDGLDGTSYYCDVIDNGIFTDARLRIDSVEGMHARGQTNKNVDGLNLESIPSVKFFPQKLLNVFGDLIAIGIASTNLQEVKQDDLKVFPKLRCLQLHNNKITTIDANLFEFNPELTGILLYNNQISHIDPKVFDHLNNLHTLYLSANKCKNALTDVRNSRPEVLKLIQRIRNAECYLDDVLQRQKAAQAQEEAIKKAELERTKYEACQNNLLSVIGEKSELAKQVSKMEETERIIEEKVKTCETSTADLNKNLNELREQNQKLQEKIDQQKNKEDKIQATVQELTATNEKQAKDLKDLMELQGKLVENDLSNGVKMNELRVKYESILQSKLELSENLNEKLRELYDKHTSLNEKLIESKDKYTNMILNKQTETENLNEKLIECNEKYANLQNTKLIESEKVNHELNEEIRNIKTVNSNDDEQQKNIDGSCMILNYGDNQQPIILVN